MISGPGRPLRFLGMSLAGWIGLRAVMLWPHVATVPDLARALVPGLPVRTVLPPLAQLPMMTATPHAPLAWWMPSARAATVRGGRHRDPDRLALALLGFAQFGPPDDAAPEPAAPQLLAGLPRPAPPPLAPGTAVPSRWSGSFWLVARGGGGVTSAPLGGQLGGSQAGLRLAYLLARKHRIAAMARVTSPLGSGLREAAVGLEWQPTRLPVRIVAEQRVALNAGKGGPAVTLVGGFGPLPIGGGFRLETYAQAGAIHRERTEGFVDGAARVSHRVMTLGAIPLDLGAGLWGGAQRGAERLDIGPSVSATLPIAGRQARLSLDWRERVAGQARPGSGVALTLGADF
ncbi:hypothetical protein [Sphingomonas sp. BAUL-RG-20F-R05-02]|uniref:hypothetical protein n=1 Tax=Sphingomonas sp. BAUL-RG-20F-R05-02 TaxID=2914830 RepID=UPI001F5610D5|nr:hypothetical protein [Sphingomonas sp. BAUL-RG-20F-R05-02]